MIRRHPVALAMLVLLTTAALGLLLRPATPIDETRYLSVAWEMHLTGDWLVPSKNFAPYSDKPPLLFLAINLVWAIFGVSEFAARMVVPVFGALAVWLTAMLGRGLWPEDAGIGGRAALALAGLTVFGLSSGLTMFDVPLTVAALVGLICLARAAQTPESLRPWVAFGAALALGVLTKGPVILFHLLPAALLLPLWSGRRFPWRALPLRIGLGLAVALGLVAIWLVPAATFGGAEYRAAILWHQSAGRLTESFAHARPWWFYPALLPVLTFPLAWSPTLWRAARHAPWRAEPGLRLCLIQALAALVLFSLTSGKQLHYLVPELPALALIAARLMADRPRFGLAPAGAVLAMAAVGAVLAGVGLLPLGHAATLLTPRSALVAWGLLVLTLCWLGLRARGFAGALILSAGLLLATNLLIGVTAVAPAYSTREIAAELSLRQADGIAYVGATYHAEFNFAARLTGPVATPADAAALRAWAASHPAGTILGRPGALAPDWPPFREIRFRSQGYGLWSVADAPQSYRSVE